MRLFVTKEVFDGIQDPSKRDPRKEAARQRTLARVSRMDLQVQRLSDAERVASRQKARRDGAEAHP